MDTRATPFFFRIDNNVAKAAMDREASSSEDKYKVIEYNDDLFRVPIRRIDQQDYVLLSDVQALIPSATALLSSDKLLPFATDPNSFAELVPKRVAVTEYESAWQVHIPEASDDRRLVQKMMDMEIKLDRLSRQLNRLLAPLTTATANASSTSPNDIPTFGATDSTATAAANPVAIVEEEDPASAAPATTTAAAAAATTISDHHHHHDVDVDDDHDHHHDHHPRPRSPPPAFSSSPPLPLPRAASSSNATTASARHMEGEAPPPSYETSVLGNIKALTDHMRVYESHIANRHKSPRWLARRSEWVRREPGSIEQVAFQLVQLEMALLWTAVTEGWIQERETWLTLVGNARSERHIASAMINLERHTLVMDDEWASVREGWINELLELIVLPLTHG